MQAVHERVSVDYNGEPVRVVIAVVVWLRGRRRAARSVFVAGTQHTSTICTTTHIYTAFWALLSSSLQDLEVGRSLYAIGKYFSAKKLIIRY